MSTARPPLSHDEVVEVAGLYVLRALDDGETAAVRAHLAACPMAHPELEELGGVTPYLLEDVELIEPPASLRDRILAAAAAEPRVVTAASAERPVTAPAAPMAPPPADVIVDARERFRPTVLSRSVDWAFRIAAVVAILALGAWNFTLQGRLDAAETDRAAVAGVLELARTEGSLTAVIRGDAGGGIAAVGPDGTTRLAIGGLAPTTGSEVYTAWAIVGADAAPMPIGEFTVGAGGNGSLATTVPVAQPGVTLALTREPGPGAQTPTLPIVALGTTQG